ncbi:MAG: response regulator [Desulfoplanes sp.]|nr:response regulator [Desulfoplanes sp.]
MNNDNRLKSIEILYIEDDPGDIRLTQEVLKDTKIKIKLNVVTNGKDALAYLNREGEFATALRPDLIWLDLNLPAMDGRDVLQAIKQDEHLKTIPVVILTTSAANEDIARTYALGANCYVTKPVGLEAFAKMVEQIEGFWFTVVKFPPKM